MSITLLMCGLLFGGALAWFLEGVKAQSARWVSLLTVLVIGGYFAIALNATAYDFSTLQLLVRVAWISSFHIEYALALDYLSIVLILLTLFLALICVLVSWQEINDKVGFYYFNLLTSIAGIIGVFTAVDMFLFFFFWEVMLLPITALIAIWGHENRHFAAIKFFIFTQLSSLLMLVAIISMSFIHYQQVGQLSFFYQDWLTLDLPLSISQYLMLGFFIAFAVKLPSVPVHSWLPDAHTQAPTAGSVLLAGVLLKTGAYGLIRFVLQLFPQASVNFAPVAATLGVVSILYGAKMAFAQQDLKRLVAYSSISHMGFVMLALFSFNAIAYQGAVLTLVAHGLSSAALFALAGMIYSRIHSRDLNHMGGFWLNTPRMGGFALAFSAAAFGLPGLANFVAEFLSLVGAYQRYPILTILAAFGLIGSAIYGMVLFQGVFHGKCQVKQQAVNDLSSRELLVFSSLLALLIFIGFYPNSILGFFQSDSIIIAINNTVGVSK
ncbi:complex I subunit 4 family protein [Candidatus Colwellia aromaticivorans]|uniref:complex I subunit 4 family protein n=1 Tax=Candidatus Colwellia aromaticivorans TaxID=2267621 RepID=UPI000DF1ECE0|nr:NADH-quinone oxidoreductase subunit M [Candidatus Colwellia aromaticivorans]